MRDVTGAAAPVTRHRVRHRLNHAIDTVADSLHSVPAELGIPDARSRAAFAARRDGRLDVPGMRWSTQAWIPFDDPSQIEPTLQKVKDLGFTALRTEVFWDQVEPVPGQWDEKRLATARRFLERAGELGIEPLVILSNLHSPAWARSIFDEGDKDGYLDRFKTFTRKVSAEMGQSIPYYQFGNENGTNPNPAYWMHHWDDNWKLYLAGDQGVREGCPGHPYEATFNMNNNPVSELSWVPYMKYVVSHMNQADPQHHVRMVSLDPYPGTWMPGGSRNWNDVAQLLDAVSDPKSPAYGFDPAIMETGFSSFQSTPHLPRFVSGTIGASPADTPVLGALKGRLPVKSREGGEADQATWYREALPALATMVSDYNVSHPDHPVKLTSLYVLDDPADTRDGRDPEQHFGLLHHDGTPKPAALVVKRYLTDS